MQQRVPLLTTTRESPPEAKKTHRSQKKKGKTATECARVAPLILSQLWPSLWSHDEYTTDTLENPQLVESEFGISGLKNSLLFTH